MSNYEPINAIDQSGIFEVVEVKICWKVH